MRAVSFVTRLVTQGRVIGEQLPHVLIHSIADDEFMGAPSSTSKYNAYWEFLTFPRDQGRKCAGDWLSENFVKLGVELLVDIDKMYL
jgi:NTE family protein